MRRTAGMIGSVILIGCFFAAAVGNASGPEITRALNRLADTLQPQPVATPTVVPCQPVSATATEILSGPVTLWLILVGTGMLLLLGGLEFYRRVTLQPLDPEKDSLETTEPECDGNVELFS